MQTFTVQEKIGLGEYLFKALPGIKKTNLKNYLISQAVFVNGRPVTQYHHALEPGDQITLERDKEKARVEQLRSTLKILHEDEALIVIEKPAGLLTIATEKIKTRTAFYQVYEYLKQKQALQKIVPRVRTSGRPLFIVHRLDRDASGLLILAKTLAAKVFLQEHWHEFEKKYYAVVEGTPKSPEADIESYLKENKMLRVFSSDRETEGSKFSRTHYRVVKSSGKRSLLDVTLKTGRKHQIRVHMASIGHPILGDKDYGNADLSKRLALHAYSLTVKHPISGKTMHFKTEMPAEMERLLKD